MLTLRLAPIPALAMAGALAASSTAPAFAGTATSTMTVSATVINTCTISAGSMAFGTYNPNSGSAVSTTASITTLCTPGASATLSMNTGLNAGGATNFTSRAMNNGASLLTYNIYTDAAHSHIWGDGTTGTSTVPVGGGLSDIVTTAYGLLPAGQNVTALSFSDSVTVTISF